LQKSSLTGNGVPAFQPDPQDSFLAASVARCGLFLLPLQEGEISVGWVSSGYSPAATWTVTHAVSQQVKRTGTVYGPFNYTYGEHHLIDT
jgi:hypothetical protein